MGRSYGEGDSRRDRDDLMISRFDQLPAAFVHHPMVPATEQDQVVEVGRPAVYPMHQVMSVAHRGRSLAARPPALTIASLQSPAQSARDQPLRAPDVDRHRLLAEQDPGDAAVAGHALD